MPNYIYLDSKIIGTAYQIVQYFNTDVFDRYNTIIYFKKYKESFTEFSKIFISNHIKFCTFEKYSEIRMLPNTVVFYLFNAQSNCRIVANRSLKHIFVTHGESNKISSIKPIIRIYDYVVTAGRMGINRYLEHKIFNQMDVENGRVIMMGNTFTGKAPYQYSSGAKNLLFAPTWEGGIPEENYSSLEWPDIFYKLLTYMRTKGLITLVIQPHPNLGHRVVEYKDRLYKGINFLLQQGVNIILVKDEIDLKDYYLRLKFKSLFKAQTKNQPIAVKEAFTDISAMEAQLYASFIPVRTFIKEKQYNFNDKFLNYYYRHTAIFNEQDIPDYQSILVNEFYNYIFGYSFPNIASMPLHERLEWLCHHVYTH
ncbi:hypothetical protein [Alkanindiges illinoisensis]|uniref:hypothetical protein n=1 Tax=Alkanindiges illinoisensis TaxID=197183 RepID=UPI00055268F8|nr:hypothetical protein [Alkanindiges illinoisensis]